MAYCFIAEEQHGLATADLSLLTRACTPGWNMLTEQDKSYFY